MPKNFGHIYVFPGVELSVNGDIQLLAIVGCDIKTSDIESLLAKVEFDGDKGASNGVACQSLIEENDEITLAGAIAIPAHVDKAKGLFESMQGPTLEQVLDARNIFAMELVDPDYEKLGTYADKTLRWAEVPGSDIHHPSCSLQEKFPSSHVT